MMFGVVYKAMRYCSKIDKDAVMDTAYSVFRFGKASVSISQHLINPQINTIQEYSNYYIHHDLCNKLDPQFASTRVKPGPTSTPQHKPQQKQQQQQQKQQQQQPPLVNKIFRVIINAEIGQPSITLDINNLRKNKIIDQLVILHQSNKYASKSQRILIDDIVQDSTDPEVDAKTRLAKNMMEVQKLLQTGFSLPVAYMISNKNVLSKNWIEALKTKNKALHSNIVEKLGHKSQGHPSLEQYMFHNGFRINHLFLKPYLDGKPVQRLAQANNFNIKQLVNVLNIIDFQGKIVIQNTQFFNENVFYLEQALKNGRFLKQNIYDSDGLMWYLFI